ncbi:MAG: peptidylprolyl isomerase, partial [bacterium]
QAVANGVKTGASLEAVADGHGLRVMKAEDFTRTSNVTGIGSVNEVTASAFAMPVGQVGEPIELNGSFYVVRVDSRTPYDRQQLAQQMLNLKLQANMSKSQGYIQDWYQAARAEVDVEDYRGAGY